MNCQRGQVDKKAAGLLTDAVEEFKPEHCDPNDLSSDCCELPAVDCGATATVIAGVAAGFSDLVTGGEGDLNNTADVKDFFVTYGASEFGLSSDLLDLIANGTEELKIKVRLHNGVSYNQIFKNGVLLFVLTLT